MRHFVHVTPQSQFVLEHYLNIFLEIERINLGQENLKLFKPGTPHWEEHFSKVSPLDRTDKTRLVIRYCFSLSGIMTSSATNTGQMVRFILLLFSIKPNSIWLSAYFLNIAGLGLTSLDDMDCVLHEKRVEMVKQQSCDWVIDSWLRLLWDWRRVCTGTKLTCGSSGYSVTCILLHSLAQEPEICTF